jgi:hypothetical protein
MLVIEGQNQKYFDEVVEFAKTAGLYEPVDEKASDPKQYLKKTLDRLDAFTRTSEDGEIVSRVVVYPDWAPRSFGFTVQTRGRDGEWNASLVGGVIFHGADGGGNGGAPTFSVSLTPTDGWSIHT